MDDFILLTKTKEEARILKRKISTYLKEKLNLSLNAKSKYYPNEHGVDFCGYRVYETHRLLRKRGKQKIRKLIRRANRDFQNGMLDYQKVKMCYNSWKAHASHANSYRLVQKCLNQFPCSDYLKEE